MMNSKYFSHFIFIGFLSIIALVFTHCTTNEEDYAFTESSFLGIWVSDRYETYDGEEHVDTSRLEFFADYVLIDSLPTEINWALWRQNYQGGYSQLLRINGESFEIVEVSKTNLIYVDNRDEEKRIQYYTRE